jgi:hypothetical protein
MKDSKLLIIHAERPLFETFRQTPLDHLGVSPLN